MVASEKSTQLPPFSSVIIPLYNDATYIERCLRSVLDQDYPPGHYEIIIVDGGSSDGSRELVDRAVVNDGRVRVFHNPKKIVSEALNLGLKEAKGQFIVRVDSHCVLEPDYVRQCVDALQASGAANVGGPMRPVGSGLVGQGLALALCNPFGIGNSRFHYVTKSPEYVDTVYLGAFRRDVFEKVGLFDPSLTRNQDDEFNYRLRLSGERVLLVPEIKSWYFCRNSLSAIWKQHFGYGFWKVFVIGKHRRLFAVRHIVPSLFVLAVALAALVGMWMHSWAGVYLVVIPYMILNIAMSMRISSKKGWRFLIILPAVFATMHSAYGIGFLAGALSRGIRRNLDLQKSKRLH